ncbi:hypothetical protein [Polynucleobacter asymbioticus]|jgi:hypothetical protein|uniref:Uncharacterized protein n=1 Tax=Polynucleobacter asymbioticus TaxID=576611 RepID=A0AAC9NJ53_9BURK|nr:hypothetical protein [Polynucleobacter asymbioticus]APC01619.1 hypothetical protein AOC25_08270 [Polynucleobacter asymbioticus]
MTYIVFNHTHTPADLISSLSLALLISEDKFDYENVVVGHYPQKLTRFSQYDLIGNLLACDEYRKKQEEFTIGYTIVKVDKKLTTDKFLSKFNKPKYIGCLPNNTTKKALIDSIKGFQSIASLEKLKGFFDSPLLFIIKHSLPNLDMTDKEIESLIKIDKKQTRDVHSIINQRLSDANANFNSEPILIKNF